MGRNNQEKKPITLDEACGYIHAFMEKAALSTGAKIWIGTLIKETPGGYIFPASLYFENDKPHDNYIRAWVNKWTGEVSLALDLTS